MQENMNVQALDGAVQEKPGAVARLVQYAAGRYIALPAHTTLEVIEHPKAVPVPGAAYYAHGLLTWQDQRVPMIDMQSLLKAYPLARELQAPRYALIVAYQDGADGSVRQGAIGMDVLPESISIADDARCELPGDSDLWPLIAIACFGYEGKPVPVVDTGRLFGMFHG